MVILTSQSNLTVLWCPSPSQLTRVGSRHQADGTPVGHQRASVRQQPISGVQHRVQHALEQQEVAHPLGDDHVELSVGAAGQFGVLQPALDQRDDVREAVLPGG